MNFLNKSSQRMSRLQGILLIGVVAMTACGGPRATEPPVTQLQISPKALTLETGQTNQFVVLSAPGRTGLPITWTSSNPSVATVSSQGVATGIAAGTAAITARSGGQYSASAVTVTDPPVTLQILPDILTLATGQTREFVVASVPAGGLPVTWTSSNPTVVTVSEHGVATGVAAGTATITATSGNQHSASAVTVSDQLLPLQILPDNLTLATGQAREFTVVSEPIGGPPVTWTSSNPTVVTVSHGVATAVAGGTATITAASQGLSATSTVTVTDPPVTQIRISPEAVTVEPGEKTQLLVASTPARSDMPVTWATSNDAVAIVTDMGVVTGISGGRATITATRDGATATSTVTVTDPPVGQLRISPVAVTLEPGGMTQLVANWTPWRPSPITWSINDNAVATVSNNGVVTGVAEGRAVITVTSDGVTTTSSVTVAARPVSYGFWPNEPPGMTLLSDRDFSDAVPVGEDKAMGGAWYINNPSSNASRVYDATAPFSAPYVLQVAYPAGFAGGSAPATAYVNIPREHGTELYVGFWWKASDPWHGHNSDVNKLLFVYTDTTTGAGGRPAFIPEMFGPPGGPYGLRTYIQNLAASEPSAWAEANVGDGTLIPGRWYRIELYAKHGTSSTSFDGILKQWVNGVLVTNYSDINYSVHPFNIVEFSPTWGGIGDVKTETDFFLFDHVRISGR